MTNDVVAARREFINALETRAIVEDINWTRDGYQTVVLQLGDPTVDTPSELDECLVCGATELSERIEEHDCQDFLDWRATP